MLHLFSKFWYNFRHKSVTFFGNSCHKTLKTYAPVPDNVRLLVAKALLSFITLVLSVNLLGWALKLGRLASTIQEAEEGLERLKNTSTLDVPQVIRLVSEYNCQVVDGIPIHSWL